MPGNRFDVRNMPQQIAEGTGDEALRVRSTYRPPEPQYPSWLRFIVLEVISDPTQIDKTKLSHWEHDLGVANIQYATVAPRNSIIARRVMGPGSSSSEKVMVLWPACPSHISMPAKPGEHVWGFFENPQAKVNEIGYWLWKISQPHHVDDQNYTHADRALDPSFVPGISDIFQGTAEAKYEFHNGGVGTDTQSGDRYAIGDTASAPGDDKFYTNLLQNTDAAKIAQYEPVPRYRKRPPDIAFEGSNNTLIVLGTDRTGPLATFTQDPDNGMVPGPVAADASGQAGAIDIVVGRGQTQNTGGSPVQNVLNNKEIGKDKQNLQADEGDVDWISDRSRVLVSQKTKVDTNLKIDSIVNGRTSSSAVKDGNGEGAIVVKTDKLRLVARHDVVILVTGATSTDGNGNVQDPAAGNGSYTDDNCASVIIRTNGDIIFQPAKKGVVKLGGDDANLAVLCQVATTGAGDNSGSVTSTPIVDTLGGTEGTGSASSPSPSGQFATKVLLK